MALACDIRGKSLPPTSKRYYHNGQEVCDSDRVKIVDRANGFSSELVIDPVMKCDEGIYMCVAEFACESEPILMVCSTEYLTFPENEISEDRAILKLRKALQENVVVSEGFEVDLLLEVESASDFDYVWMKDGKCVPNGEDFVYIDHGHGVVGLRLTDPFLVDFGYYKCIVKNVNGDQVESGCEFSVIEKECEKSELNVRPEFENFPQPVFIRSGSDVTYACRVQPRDAELTWIVNGLVMTNELEGVAVSNSNFCRAVYNRSRRH